MFATPWLSSKQVDVVFVGLNAILRPNCINIIYVLRVLYQAVFQASMCGLWRPNCMVSMQVHVVPGGLPALCLPRKYMWSLAA